MRYLTKGRFKLALECPTKLYYTKNKDYSDLGQDDPFMIALAKGGYQIGAFAKYKYCADPIGEDITIDTLDENEALRITQERLQSSENVVIAEAAFAFKNLFFRADFVVRSGTTLHLIEVKSKSWAEDDSYMNKVENMIVKKWQPYVYDVAFQTYVLENAMPGFTVKPYLLLVNKDAKASNDGLNQLFKVVKDENGRTHIKTQPGLTAEQINNFNLLKEIPMREAVDFVFKNPIPNTNVPAAYSQLGDFIHWAANLYENGERVWTKPSTACKQCTFKRGDSNKQCGFSECWSNHKWADAIVIDEASIGAEPNVTELWMGRGGKDIGTLVMNQNVPFVSMLEPEGLKPKSESKKKVKGMTPFERREHQIYASRVKEDSYVFYKSEFNALQAKWNYPLNMIDFETSTTALPFFKGMRPYETVAFQFSHHIMYADGRVEHFNDFISWEHGKYPNLDFVRALKKSLESNNGTIFRYASHENSVLNKIKEDVTVLNPADKNELLEFIDSITEEDIDKKNKRRGGRNMVDLADVVREYYYSSIAVGSNSIKKILPAIIHDCPSLVERYSNENIYGKDREYSSLNFTTHTWITPETQFDPYKTLLPITRFDGVQEIEVFDDLGEVADGSAAMTAYNKLQWSDISDEERRVLKDALLQYCELDTLAMVMLMQGLLALEDSRGLVLNTK